MHKSFVLQRGRVQYYAKQEAAAGHLFHFGQVRAQHSPPPPQHAVSEQMKLAKYTVYLFCRAGVSSVGDPCRPATGAEWTGLHLFDDDMLSL